jgi:hypothetical protein
VLRILGFRNFGHIEIFILMNHEKIILIEEGDVEKCGNDLTCYQVKKIKNA